MLEGVGKAAEAAAKAAAEAAKVVGKAIEVVGEAAQKAGEAVGDAVQTTAQTAGDAAQTVGDASPAQGYPQLAFESPADPDPPGGRPDDPGIPAERDFTTVRQSLDEGAVLEKSRNSEIYGKAGDSETAAADFDRLSSGLPINTYPNGTRVATLSDGTVVSLRGSSDGRTTIELLQRDPRVQVKYRYGDM